MSERPERILVVDDSATQAEEARLVLESAGFAVETAPDAEAALLRLEETPADLVISDIVMPGRSGYELCRHLRGDPRWTRTPVLLLTSLTEPIDVMHALECGADSFLTKPYEPDSLIARVRGLLENRRLRAGARPGAGVGVLFGGKQFVIASEREQILDLLVSTFEDMVQKNEALAAARDTLAAQHERLQRAERQKEELSALLVHDLKSPASGIMMAAQTRLRSSTLSDVDRTLWRLVFTSAEVINRMVMNLLDISRSSEGGFAVRRVSVDVRKLLDDVQMLMMPSAESRRQRIDVQVAGDLSDVRADPELLRRVLQNLVDNALRHSPADSVVAIEALGVEGGLRLRVRDRGPGVPPAMRDKIFDKYVRAEGQGGSLGRGLGLAFCRMAVEAHGGRIWVEDDHPAGSIFSVDIPAQR